MGVDMCKAVCVTMTVHASVVSVCAGDIVRGAVKFHAAPLGRGSAN